MRVITAATIEYHAYLDALLESARGICEVEVYDLGLGEHAKRLKARPVDLAPALLKMEEAHPKSPHSHPVPGRYAWKPMVIRQAMREHGSILWVDAGVTFLRDAKPLFEEVEQRGFFAQNMWAANVGGSLCVYPRQKLGVTDAEAAKPAISAGVVGIHSRWYYPLVCAWARMAEEDLDLFLDHGDAPLGAHMGRHDQSLLQVLVARLGLIPEKSALVSADREHITDRTVVYHSRSDTGAWRDYRR